MNRFSAVLLVLSVAVPFAALTAQRVDSKHTHARMWVVDTVIVDAKTNIKKPAHVDGMLGFVAVYHPVLPICIVEYVAAHPKDFDLLKAHAAVPGSNIQHFEKAKTDPKAFDAVARALGFGKIDFDNKFYVRVP